MSIRTWGSLKNGSRAKRANAPRQEIDEALAFTARYGPPHVLKATGSYQSALQISPSAPRGVADSALYTINNNS